MGGLGEFVMRSVTEGLVIGVFATAKKCLFFYLHLERKWGEFGALMRSVAKGLIGGFPASTPKITTRSEFQTERGLSYNYWLCHLHSPNKVILIPHSEQRIRGKPE